MSFLNPTGVTTLWSRIINYLTGSHVKTSVVSGATDVDGALTKLQTKTGISALTTQATDLSGAVNELNSDATEMKATDNAIESGLAIVANGDTHPAIKVGQYVYVKGHSILAEEMYIASEAIPTDDPLTTSNLTALNAGSLNVLNSGLAALRSSTVKINTPTTNADTFADGITIITNTSGISNLPADSRCVIESWTIYDNPLRRIQIAYELSNIYVRRNTGTWTPWKKILTE